MQSWKIQLFGSLAVQGTNGVIYDRFETKRSAQILARLAISKNGVASRESLADLLWPDDYYDATRVRLRQELSRLRRSLGLASTLIEADLEHVRMNQSVVTTDLGDFYECCKKVSSSLLASEQIEFGERGLRISDTDLLKGWDDDWVEVERSRIVRHRVKLAIALGEIHRDAEEFEKALEFARSAVEQDPFSEAGYMLAMQALGNMGEVVDALAQFQQMRRVLREGLNKSPSESAVELMEQLKSGAFVSSKTQTSHLIELAKPRLPMPIDRFFGRETELENVVNQLRGNDGKKSRLVTILGMGGIGKTRLAMEVALKLDGAFADGPRFLNLADVQDSKRFAETLLLSVGLQVPPNVDAFEYLTRVMPDKSCLIVLDNLEQLLPELAELVRALLHHKPQLSLLITSRIPLKITGEHLVHLEPLPVESSEQSPAVQLFVDQAQSVKSTFELTDENRESVIAIVERMEGIPLAIRVAAARMRLMTPKQLLDQLTDRLSIIRSGLSDLPERHRTLQVAIDWSFRQLPDSAQQFMKQLWAFRGGWNLDQAAQISGNLDALQMLELLNDYSLVNIEDSQDTVRFRMLETVRDYVATQMDADELHKAYHDHSSVLLTLINRCVPREGERSVVEHLKLVDHEIDNLRFALKWVVDNDLDLAIKIGGRLWRYWMQRGQFREGCDYFDLLHPKIPADYDQLLKVECIVGYANLKYAVSELADALALAEEAASIFQELHDPIRQGHALVRQALVAMRQSRFEDAIRLLDEALSLSSPANPGLNTFIYNTRAYVLFYQCKLAESFEAIRTAFELATEFDDPYVFNAVELKYAWVLYELQRMEEAKPLADDARKRALGLRDSGRYAAALELPARIAFEEGDLETAQTGFEGALELWTITGDPHQIADQNLSLGRVAFQKRELDTAWQRATYALQAWTKLGDHGGVNVALHSLAQIHAFQGRPQLAVHLISSSDKNRRDTGFTVVASELRFVESLTDSLRKSLGEEAFQKAWDEGQQLERSTALKLALTNKPSLVV